MTADDVRLTAQLVVDDRVHCVSDEAVKALAKRVLELEALVSTLTLVIHGEREACAKLAERNGDFVTATGIRNRGLLRSTPTLDDVKLGGA